MPIIVHTQATASPAPPPPPPLSLPPLPYGYDTLEPVISSQVGSGRLPITAAQETTLRNQGGGLWNHQLFWKVMASPGSAPTSRSAISPALLSAIQRAFGSVDEMLAQLKGSADAVFGSGWAWVCVPSTAGDSNASGGGGGGLQLLTTANQDNPLMKASSNLFACVVRSQPCAPILGIDVWEHAYYLQYQAKRSDYTQAWQQQLINWAAVSAFYEAAAAGDLSYNDT
ncbi:hypothetical protein HYH02_004649 [Chlamydomonas schloesseri]|uniref:superoxide dismutase n=1 Tax=Chlamydomonas schloesseri TaxID=2026947 RepID=A0A835WP37_9CHLO|nr:hypothetical protein HYH02_004649 [Chlamydomonas schloesseri]|eukprot:KAG2450814.1 hypothetical protein HYH02_004649 [Chlamydomonas schloesseri]